jgi:hypothetical protein
MHGLRCRLGHTLTIVRHPVEIAQRPNISEN